MGLQLQSEILLCLDNGVSDTLAATLHRRNHKLVGRVSISDECRARYVKQKGPSILSRRGDP